jgi:uncharacterized membrane protein YedE/YeeE
VIRSLNAFVGLTAGLLFGVGLVIGGMTDPAKVRGFLDFSGRWDPTLAFVMAGAIAVHFTAYRLIRGRAAPALACSFQLPTRRGIDAKLLAGAALFGVGWGLGGYCPGPAITSLTTGGPALAVFVVAMLGASWLTGRAEAWLSLRKSTIDAEESTANQGRLLAP